MPALAFLLVIVALLMGLCGIYYCLNHDLCPCTHMDKDRQEMQKTKKEGYEELQVAEEEDIDSTDDEAIASPLPEKQPREEQLVSETDGGPGAVLPAQSVSSGVGATGRVHIKADYGINTGRLKVTIVEAGDMPSKGRGSFSQCRVHALLLPHRKQRFKTKSKAVSNPRFDETFVFDRLAKSDLFQMAIRMRLYGHDKIGKEKLVGETVLQLADVVHAPAMKLDTWRDVRPKVDSDDEA